MEEEYIYQGRIAICEPTKVSPYHQYRMSAVLICPEGQPKICESGDYENIQCEIIIRPLKRLGKSKIKGMRLDQAALALGDDNQWGEQE